jgi:hypothetical protein
MKLAISASLITGSLWGLLGTKLFADPGGFNLKIELIKGVGAGAATGLIITLIFLPVYKFTSKKNLIWATPISVYLSIFLFTFILQSAFYPGSGMEEVIRIVGLSWWALTLWFALWPLFGVSLLNHLLVRHLILKADQGAVGNG